MDEVERPARIDLGLNQDRCACSNGFAPGPAFAHRQALLAIEPVDAVDARRLALADSSESSVNKLI
jgi:hypothetical protein